MPQPQATSEAAGAPAAAQVWLTRARSPLAIATAAAVLVVIAYLVAPRMGQDLSAQIARADFTADNPLGLVDLRWFGGTLPFGYSLWVPAVMATIGVRVTGAIATVLAAVLFTRLLVDAKAPHPTWGAIAVSITLGSNLAEGRVTFACGVACGLGALVALSSQARSSSRWTVSIALALLAGAASPVACLLLMVCALALLAGRRYVDALTLCASIPPTLVISVLFADGGGQQVFSANDAIRALLASAFVVAVLPRQRRALQIGAGIGLFMVAVAWLLPTPVGSNATRLSLLFAIPLIAAFVAWRSELVVLCVVAAAVIQSPVVLGTLTKAGAPDTNASYFRPLLDELARRGTPSGRLEIPELTGHWEAAYVAPKVPLARGWLRQTDTELNGDVFYDNAPTAQIYRDFLDRNAVQYVAVADARATFYGRREADLIAGGLPYLSQVWQSAHWTLYAVRNAVPIVSAPAKLVRYEANQIVLSAPADTDVTVRMRWFRWLDVVGDGQPCLRRAGPQTVVLHTGLAGKYTVHASVYPLANHCS